MRAESVGGGGAWSFHNPTRVVFGAGTFGRLGEVVGGRPYALVTYGEPLFAALAGRVGRIAGRPRVRIDGIGPNPDVADLGPACASLPSDDAGIAMVVAVGGGSVIDAAKVVAAAGRDFAVVRSVLETGAGHQTLRSLPIVAVPTTAGTGSEVTSWATVWDRSAGRKYSLADPSLYPECAIVDPELTIGVPRDLTVSTGLDALSHALESIWNVNANPASTALAVDAASTSLAILPALVDDLSNPRLRADMARAALVAGLAFSNTKTALAHSLSYPVTLEHGVPHGIACSFSLPFVMRAVVGTDAACDAALGRIFGPDLEAGAARLEGFLEGLGVSPRPVDHGVAAEDWRRLVENALDGERGHNFLGDAARVLAEVGKA